jgi:phenylalanine ammonia-lyase
MMNKKPVIKAPIIISGDQLTIGEVVQVARCGAQVNLTKEVDIINQIHASCNYLQNAVKIGEPIYGVTSGFGGMANVVIPAEEAEELQNNMPWFHKVGAGKLLPAADVRASMLLRANSLMRGVSGVRLELIRRLEIFLNVGITPHIYDLGSIGASGDLTPLSYIAAAITGLDTQHKVTWNGEEMHASAALERLGLPKLRLLPKESLAIMNGTSVMTGIAALCVDRFWKLAALALGTHALFMQALSATNQSFHPFIHQHKPHPGQVWTAAHTLDLLAGSYLIRDEMYGRNNYRNQDLIQDRYSIRCLPQYWGPIIDGLHQITRQIEIEINAATDNPLIDVAHQASYHCGNFLGQYVGVAMDQLRYYIGLLAKHLDVQIALLVAPEFNQGLPASLVGNPTRTVNMGLKGLQLTGNSIMPLLTFLGHSLVDHFPTHAEQFNQNINSQGFGSANLARQSLDLLQQYMAIALIFGVQAVDLRTYKVTGHYDARACLSPATARLYQAVREVVGKPPSEQRPYIWNDNEQALDEHIQRLVADIEADGQIVQAIEDTLHSVKNAQPVAAFSKIDQPTSEKTSVAEIDWGNYTKMNIAQCVETSYQQFPQQLAIVFEGQSIIYQALEESVNRVANGLKSLGIQRGDRVALLLPNIPAFVFVYHGIQKIGAIAVVINTSLKTDETTFILNDSGAIALVTVAALRMNVSPQDLPHLKHIFIAEGEVGADKALHDLMANASTHAEAMIMTRDSPAVIVYTSGTTGFPKGATLSHGNVISNMQAKKRCLGIRTDDRLLLFLPLFHCFGQNAVLNSGLGAGATIVLHRQFDPEVIQRSIKDDKITMFFGVPTTFMVMYDRLTASEMQRVRYYFSAAAPLAVEVARKWQDKFGAFVYQGYGLTETSPFASYNHLIKPKLGSVGTPIEHVEMKVVDVDDGHFLKPGEVGEIAIRGPNVMLGYWNRPTETAEVLKEGWFHTGDLGKIDYEGYYYLVDRLRDMINVGGLKVYPVEVEKIIVQHPAVSDAAVYGVPDALMGEQVKASVVLKPGLAVTAEELMAFCLKRIANFKVPSAIELVEAIPKNPTGKILRRVLRERSSVELSTVPTVQPRVQTAESIQTWIVNWMSKHLEIEADTIDSKQPFVDYGMSSVMSVKLTQELGKWLGQPLEVVLAWRYSTVDSMAHYLAEQSARLVSNASSEANRPFLEYVPFAKPAEATENTIELWPSVAEFFVYDEFLYNTLTHDERRNHSYKIAINQRVKDKVVVEIGPGKDAILTRFCAQAGAKKIYAIERNAETSRLAQARVDELGLSNQITIIHGDATEVNLPELADVCVSEIVGSIGGSEGAAVIINNIRRLLKPAATILPERSVTKIAAVTFPEELENNLGFTDVSGHYVQKIFEQVGYPFDLRVSINHFPPSQVLSDAGIFEDLDFTQVMATAAHHDNVLTISQAGRVDGFLVWLTLHTIAGEVIDILEHEHSWLPIYLPVFSPGVLVSAGDTIEVTCLRTLCDNQLNPDYKLEGRVIRKAGGVIEFEYESYHYQRVFKHTPFYERLFSQVKNIKTAKPFDETLNTEGLSTEQLANLLADELAAIKHSKN